MTAQINDKHQNVIIDWGDGRQTKGYVDENSKKIKSYSTHIYRDEKNSPYKLTVSLENNRGGQAEPVSTFIYVKDKKPIFYPIGQLNGIVGEPVEVYVRFEDPGLDDKFTADLNWGDGSPTKKIVIDNRSFSVSHVFNSERNYTANVVLSSGESQSFNINISKCSNSANVPSVITSPPNVIIQNGIASISWNNPSNDGGCCLLYTSDAADE